MQVAPTFETWAVRGAIAFLGGVVLLLLAYIWNANRADQQARDRSVEERLNQLEGQQLESAKVIERIDTTLGHLMGEFAHLRSSMEAVNKTLISFLGKVSSRHIVIQAGDPADGPGGR